MMCALSYRENAGIPAAAGRIRLPERCCKALQRMALERVLIVGWAISLFVIGLILRFGQSAEILAWGINFVMLAVSGVFNPVSALPAVVQPIAKILPTTYAFRAMRTLLDGGGIPWGDVLWGYISAFVMVALGFWFIVHMLNTFRARGYVTRFS